VYHCSLPVWCRANSKLQLYFISGGLGPTAPSTAPLNTFPGATAPVPGSPYSYFIGVGGSPGVVPWLPNDEPPAQN
jgi:hypothetical protein